MQAFYKLCCCVFLLFLSLSLQAKTVAGLPRYLNQEITVDEVAKIVTKGISSDKKKAEALAVFVASYYERDGFLEKEKLNAFRKGKVYQKEYGNNFFYSRVGDSKDFALLYQALCSAVGLKAVVVEGYAGKNVYAYGAVRPEQQIVRMTSSLLTGKKDISLERYRSWWNALEIKGKWILVDTYWMIRSEKSAYKNISSAKKMAKKLAQNEKRPLRPVNNSVDKSFFDAKPKDFIKTHFPFEEKWQLIKPPVSLSRFLK